MSEIRKICIVTGTRAEYGLLYWLMKEIESDPSLRLQIIATGAHLSPEFGSTYLQIEEDGFEIDCKVEMLLSSDTPVGVGKSMGLGTIGFADAFADIDPDLVVVLGDRFETLAAVQAALVAQIVVAHIHGGEASEGAYDEAIRHSITKMSQWHFVAAEPYRRRVIQLGEPPDRVFNTGAPGLDNLEKLELMPRQALEADLGISLQQPVFLVTYHPVTTDQCDPVQGMTELLAALDSFPNATIIMTYPNADTGSRNLIDHIDRWVEKNAARARAYVSLGQTRYLSLMRECDVVLGNSSSALIEAPALKKATVNIGDRQLGRLKATSVIDAVENRESIESAIRHVLSEQFRDELRNTTSHYGSGNVCRQIKDRLKIVPLGVRKSFHDIEYEL